MFGWAHCEFVCVRQEGSTVSGERDFVGVQMVTLLPALPGWALQTCLELGSGSLGKGRWCRV